MWFAIHFPTSDVLYAFPFAAISSVTIFSVREASTALRIASASVCKPKAYSSINAAERMAARGLAMSFPAAWG